MHLNKHPFAHVKQLSTFPGSELMGTSTPNSLHAIAGPFSGPVCMTPCDISGEVGQYAQEGGKQAPVLFGFVAAYPHEFWLQAGRLSTRFSLGSFGCMQNKPRAIPSRAMRQPLMEHFR